MFFITIVLLSSFAWPLKASRMEVLAPRVVDTSEPVCTLKDFGGMLSLHDHNHDDFCLQRTQLNKSISARPEAWTSGPICKNNSNETKPFCIYTNSSFANGRGIAVITSADVAEKLANIPAFADHHDTSLDGFPPYEVRELPGKGFGVIANKTIERGDRIMAHRVLMAIHNDGVVLSQKEDIEFMNEALGYLPSSSMSLYTNMAAHFNTLDRNVERLNTNSFSEEFAGEEHWIVMPETARLNHDCRPNAIYYFDYETLTHYTHATRRIYAGEEITITYIDPLQTRKERTKATKRSWGFQCDCSLCRAPTEYVLESNRRIKTIIKLRDELEDFSPESTATPEMGELLISLHEMERLYASIWEAYMLTSLAYNAAGNDWKAVEFAMRAMEAALINSGPKSVEVRKAKKLMLDPRGHKSWMARKLDHK